MGASTGQDIISPRSQPAIYQLDAFINTLVVTPTVALEATPTSTAGPFSYLPLTLFNEVTPSPPDQPLATVLVCSDLSQPAGIPDDNQAGINHSMSITDPRFIHDLDVYLKINHTWIGDLSIRLSHSESASSTSLLNRPGLKSGGTGCSSDNIITLVDDESSLPIGDQCGVNPPAIAGSFIPEQPLTVFNGHRAQGTWTLNVSDLYPGDQGSLSHWCMELSLGETPPQPTPPPVQPDIPPQAAIQGMKGQDQALPLDCETRSAVDWAAHFGYPIDEFEFLNRLPISDNPDAGFVGNVYGAWGQIPPDPYGVHAEPVARLLREYGLPAYAHRNLSWDEVRAEIAAGRPVEAWVIGPVTRGVPVYYLANDGHLTVVARFEHTVIVTGYAQDQVTILDGGKVYNRSLSQFLESWSVLRNMAIMAHP